MSVLGALPLQLVDLLPRAHQLPYPIDVRLHDITSHLLRSLLLNLRVPSFIEPRIAGASPSCSPLSLPLLRCTPLLNGDILALGGVAGAAQGLVLRGLALSICYFWDLIIVAEVAEGVSEETGEIFN